MIRTPIKVVIFRSAPRQNVFAPAWEFPIAEDKITTVNFKKIAKLVLEKEKLMLKSSKKKQAFIGPFIETDGYTGLGKKSLTSHYASYNLLDFKHPEIKKLKKAILESHARFLEALKIPLYPELYIQCWANVMRKGEQIKAHIHSVLPDTYLGGQINVQVQDTSTWYINPVNQINDPELYESRNEVGKLTLFQNCVPHYTDKQVSTTPRITIAFDLVVNSKAPVLLSGKNFRKII
tara:strand:- start:61 stop:765 length:705 start_codon:yes stop_codon:yes gene_type:complete